MIKKFLFIINGEGLGNSTRCQAIMEELHNLKSEIKIITSGVGHWFYSDHKLFNQLVRIEQIPYAESVGKINIHKTFFNLFTIRKNIKKNISIINDTIKTFKPNVIVTDSIYFLSSIKPKSIPVISINNADLTIDEYFNNSKDRPKSIRSHFYFVELMDYLYHLVFADIILSPALIKKTEKSKKKKIIKIGPIVRNQVLLSKKKIKIGKKLFMMSGSRFGNKWMMEEGIIFPKQSYVLGVENDKISKINNVILLGRHKHNLDHIIDADFFITNGGYSAVTEAICLNRPLLVCPIPNHSEQWTNAKQIENSNIGMISSAGDFNKKVNEFIKKKNFYLENFSRLNIEPTGAEEAKKIIFDNC